MGDQAIKSIDVRLGRGNDDVAVCTAAGEHLAVGSGNANGNLAKRVDAARNALNGELGKLVFDVDDLVNSLVQRIDRTGTDGAGNEVAALVMVAVGVRGLPQEI